MLRILIPCFMAVLLQRRRARAFAGCEAGSILPIIALSALAILGATGLALDGGRLMLMNSTLQSAIDAGGLSAVAKMNTTEVTDVVRKFARSNFANGYVSADITSLNTTLNADKTVLTITATAETSTMFMKIFGISKVTSTASSQITRAMGGLELALVLDVTGSMKDYGKLAALKVAAKDLLDIMFGNNATADKLYVGIVPFSQTVNIGTTRTSWLTTTSRSWNGCVDERTGGLDQTDDPPSKQKFPRNTSSLCPPAVVPLTSTKATLVNAINGLTAIGGTHINVGAVWGWRMLSPQWRGQWGSGVTSTLPLNYGTKGMEKAVVIMTDGQNEWANGGSYGTYEPVCTRRDKHDDCTRYKMTTDERLDLSAIGEDEDEDKAEDEVRDNLKIKASAVLDTRMTKVCDSMADKGIKVFTIAFGSPGAAIETRLKACASQDSYFFSSPTAADLRVAFKTIGDSLSNLRVSR
jgi:Flp pilus assembly protein TadG